MNKSKFPDEITELKILRLKNSLTQEDLAEKIGISANTYCRKENGVVPFNHLEINDLLEEFPHRTYDDIWRVEKGGEN